MVMASGSENPTQTPPWHLSLRVDRPIEGCEIIPHAYLKLRGLPPGASSVGMSSSSAGSAATESSQRPPDVNSHFFVFRWFRGPELPVCARDDCPRRSNFNPVYWSKYVRGGSSIQCMVCAKMGVPKHESVFCSLSCFKQSWKVHSTKHISVPTTNGKADTTDNNDDEDVDLPAQADESAASDAWVLIHNDRNYTPTAEDVGKCLRVECQALAINGDVISGPKILFTEPVLAAPGPPPSRSIVPVQGVSASSGGVRFRIVSYNILAEVYATKQAYPYCDLWQLLWPYRRTILLQELDDLSSDIYCLQEVQADHYEKDLKVFLNERGYDGLFKHKTRESMGQYGKVDGCAIFWKRSKFVMVENYSIEFNECARRAAMNAGMDSDESHRFIHRLSKDNIAQVIVFETLQRNARARHHNSQICVVNTHLYSNHQRPDVKIWQCLTLVKELEQFVMQRDLPLMICGDFNSEPESAVYQLMGEQGIPAGHPEVENDPLSVLPEAGQLSHNLDLVSVNYSVSGLEPAYTNYTASFKGTLDYMWYTPSKLRVLTTALIPEEEVLTAVGEALPNAQFPSDHLSLCCDVQLAATTTVIRPPRKQSHTANTTPSKLKQRR